MMVAHSAGIQQGDHVIDVCAAPGGKSLHAAELLAGTGLVEARDLSDHKVSLLEENIRRMGLANIRAEKWDATILNEESIGQADVVICDAPCSGLGVVAKKPDIRDPEGTGDIAASDPGCGLRLCQGRRDAYVFDLYDLVSGKRG